MASDGPGCPARTSARTRPATPTAFHDRDRKCPRLFPAKRS
jgi:hypothetical protein